MTNPAPPNPELIADLTAVLGVGHVLTGDDLAKYRHEWTTHYPSNPVAVARPASTEEVAETLRITAHHSVEVVPVSGLTGLVGGAYTDGGLMISVERLNRIRDIRADARIAIVEAGVVLDRLHTATLAANLYFPLWFGARGSAMIGGVLSTNAGGSNVLRYGSTRALCLGLEVVLADGRVLNLMSELHKDNSSYDLKQLFIGAEGTLGIITAATMKLVPRPRAYATATLAARSLPDALVLLNQLQVATGGLVEAFEYMPATYMQRLSQARPDVALPFGGVRYDTNILVEIAASAPRDAVPGPDGQVPLTTMLQDILAGLMATGAVLDAEIAQSESQRRLMWQRRELAAEITIARQPTIDTDICLPVDKVAGFLGRIHARLPDLDAGCYTLSVAHLGDGNIHFTVFPTSGDADLADRVIQAVEDEVQILGGSFSAEHGVGLSKLSSMQRRKDPVALDLMRAVKHALYPLGRMNPGKVIPGYQA
jgi:FAD/FMN-containing dehydrogenase